MIPPALSRTIVPGVSDGVPGDKASGAYGNPGVSTRPPAGLPAKNPGNAYSGNPADNRTVAYGVNTPPRNGWRGGSAPSGPNQKLITRDRHVLKRNMRPRTGTEDSNTGNPPNPDGPSQGPPRPLFAFLNRTLNYQQGSDNNANQDAPDRNYSRVPMTACGPAASMNPRMVRQDADTLFAGEQGSGYAPVYGGVPGLYQPYGSYSGYTARDTKGIQSPVGQGQPGDGPRKIFSGQPHGLHSVTMPDYSPTLGRYQAIPQMHAPRLDRPSNSKIAGQDYSQLVQPQGETGTVSQGPVRFKTASRFAR